MVARMVRDHEAASSSLATSTNTDAAKAAFCIGRSGIVDESAPQRCLIIDEYEKNIGY